MTEPVKRKPGRPKKVQDPTEVAKLVEAAQARTASGRKIRDYEDDPGRGKNNQRDAISIDELLAGVAPTMIARIFGTGYDKARERLIHAKPSATLGGRPIYRIRDVARLFVKPTADDIAQVIAKTNAKDLPPQLQKDFWAAQTARQKYEEEAGQLWRAEVVAEAFMETFKIIRMTANLMADAVERETELTGKQRGIIISITDDMLAELSRKLLEHPKFREMQNSLQMDGIGGDEEIDMEKTEGGDDFDFDL